MSKILEYGAVLDDAARNVKAVQHLEGQGDLSLDDAYGIQSASIQRRLLRGERRIGVKVGFASHAKMTQMGQSDVVWSRLTSAMLVEEGAAIDFTRYVRPCAAPGLAFVLKHELSSDVTGPQALAAVDAIAPA